MTDVSGLDTSALFAVLDLGEETAVCAVAEWGCEMDLPPSREGRSRFGGGAFASPSAFRLLAVGRAGGSGVRSGEISEIARAATAARAAVESLERSCGLSVDGVCAALSGPGVRAFPVQATVAVAGEEFVVTRGDLKRAIDRAERRTARSAGQGLELLPRAYKVDGSAPTPDPRGRSGDALELLATAVVFPLRTREDLTRAVRAAGLHPEMLSPAPAALGLGALTEEERRLGSVAVDVGKGVTLYSAWSEGDLLACGAIPVGGGDITRDVGLVLRLPPEEAEELKRGLGIQGKETPGGGRRERPSPGELAEVIDARLEEIFLLVKRRIERDSSLRRFPAGVVLSGGSARLAGIEAACGRVMGLRASARLEAPSEGLRALAWPEEAVVAGLLAWAGARLVPGEGRETMISRAARWLSAAF